MFHTDSAYVRGTEMTMNRALFNLRVDQERSRNSPELFGKLVWCVWSRRLPQLDRISLRVV
jgi:hypothetical protein